MSGTTGLEDGMLDEDNTNSINTDSGDSDPPVFTEKIYSRSSCIPTRVSPYPVYVVLCLYIASVKILVVGSQDMIYSKLCYFEFQNLSLCANTSFSRTHPQIQGEATRWNNYMTVVQMIPSVLSNLLLSSYCDKVGHKLPLVLPAVGTLLASAWLSVLVTPSLIQLPMELVLVYGFLMNFLGYFPMVFMSAFSYISRARPGESRHIYITIGEASVIGGAMLGSVITGPVIDNLGLDVLIYSCTALSALTVFLTLFSMVDILKGDRNQVNWRDFFKPNEIFAVLRMVYKTRPNGKRLLLIIGFFTFTSSFVGIEGFMTLLYLYCVKTLGITVTYLSIYSAAIELLKSIFGPLFLLLVKKLGWSSLSAVQMGSIFLMAGYVIVSLRSSVYTLWMGSVLMFPQVAIYGVLRNQLISLVEEDEYGKVFSFIALLQILIQLAATIFFNALYGWTLYFWPQMYCAICGFLYLITLVFISLFIVKKIQYLGE